jgi:hypothetical protein
MGRALAWFTVESAELAGIAAALDVKVTGRRGQSGEFPLAARKLTDGRWLVVSSNCDEPVFSTKNLTGISRLGRTFSGIVEEHVMACGFAAWGKGRKSWSIQHQGENDPLHLKISGKLPQNIAALKDAALESQRRDGDEAGIDYLFEFLIDLVQPQTGLDPNVDFESGEFEQLHTGFWRELWRRTFWWRLLFVLLAGGMLFIYGMIWFGESLRWLLESLGWR